MPDDPSSHSGAAQHWDPARYQRQAGFVATLGEAVLEWLAPQPGERILDLGCGDGVLTEKLVAAGADVVGVDASAEQVAAACTRGLDARVMDGERLSFDREFDAVFSNAALHWMRNPEAAIDGVRRALRPGGRFVGEFGGRDNVATIVGALVAALERRGLDAKAVHPWYFPDESEYGARLERHGFAVGRIERFTRPTPLPGELSGWLETFAESFLRAVAPADRPGLVAEVVATTAATLRDADGRWHADYVRLRFAARLASPHLASSRAR
ncbi:MAG: methyltransferase domain-containing protein [Dongiaceae bacterium]